MFENRLAVMVTAVVATVLVAQPARAQSSQLRALAATSPVPAIPTAPPFTEALAEARRLAENGQIIEARQLYATTAVLQGRADEYPKEALENLALMAYGDGANMAAATLFDELAVAARQFDDPETELTALFRAAVFYQRERKFSKVADHILQIRTQLKSPAISWKVSSEIAGRLDLD